MARGSVLGALCQRAVIDVSQGSADAYNFATLQTGISTAARYGWLIERVQFSWFPDTLVAAPQTADWWARAQLHVGDDMAAITTPTTSTFVCEHQIVSAGIASAVNGEIIPTQYTWEAPENFVIVDPTIQLLVDSNATGAVNTAYAEIFYFPIELSEMDILRLIAQR